VINRDLGETVSASSDLIKASISRSVVIAAYNQHAELSFRLRRKIHLDGEDETQVDEMVVAAQHNLYPVGFSIPLYLRTNACRHNST